MLTLMSPLGVMSCWKSLPPWDEEGPGCSRLLPSSRDMQGQGRELVHRQAHDACSSPRSFGELLGLIRFPSPVKPQSNTPWSWKEPQHVEMWLPNLLCWWYHILAIHPDTPCYVRSKG